MSNDLIFAMGAPGSRWSGILRTIQMYHKCINTSDDRKDRQYDRHGWDKHNEKFRLYGWHRGAYFGPSHEHGQGFDDIRSNYTKESFLEEIKKPFDNWDGVKIIKSHWFAYNIDVLKEWFPDSKMIAVRYGDVYDMFAWWHFVGGWEIPYPHYDWYDNNKRMFEQIQKETDLIESAFDMKQNRSMAEINSMLGIDPAIRSVDEMVKLDNKFEANPAHDQSLERHLESFDRISARLYIGII